MNSEEAAQHWDMLADREIELRNHAIKAGWGSPVAYNARIEQYRNTAAAIRRGRETGEAHCVCHVVPSTRCPRRNKRMR
jgi:hypothetical protein